MGKNFSTIKGLRKDAYFAELMNAEITDDEKLDRLCTEVSSAWVRNACIPRGNLSRKVLKVTPPAETATPAPAEPLAPVVDEEDGASDAVREKPFDPFSVHTTNIYKKEGADGLLHALSAIGSTAHLKSMVTAQRIPVAGLDKIDDVDTMRASIVTAVAERISDRKAAAS